MSAFNIQLAQNLETYPIEDGPSADRSTRQPKVGEDTIIGFQVERTLPDIPANAEVYPGSQMPELEKETQYEGDVVFLSEYDIKEAKANPRRSMAKQEEKPRYRTLLSGLPVGTEIVPIAFIPKTEKPFQNAGRQSAVANGSVTGTFLAYNRYNKTIPAGSSLMAIAPSLDQLAQPHTRAEAYGEFRPIWVPVEDVLEDLKDVAAIETPTKAKHAHNRNRLRTSRLRTLVKEAEARLFDPRLPPQQRRAHLGKIIHAAALYGDQATRACKAIALEHVIPNAPALCQWKP